MPFIDIWMMARLLFKSIILFTLGTIFVSILLFHAPQSFVLMMSRFEFIGLDRMSIFILTIFIFCFLLSIGLSLVILNLSNHLVRLDEKRRKELELLRCKFQELHYSNSQRKFDTNVE